MRRSIAPVAPVTPSPVAPLTVKFLLKFSPVATLISTLTAMSAVGSMGKSMTLGTTDTSETICAMDIAIPTSPTLLAPISSATRGLEAKSSGISLGSSNSSFNGAAIVRETLGFSKTKGTSPRTINSSIWNSKLTKKADESPSNGVSSSPFFLATKPAGF